MLAITGDVVIQTVGGLAVAGVAAWGGVAAARRSKRTEEKAGAVEAQLLPNGGSSFRDLVDRRFSIHDERFGRIEESLDGVARTLHRIERRQTDITGETPIVE